MYGETRPRTPPRSTLASTLSRHSTYSIPSIQSCCGRRKGARWSLEGSSEGKAKSPSSISPRAGATNQCQPRNIPDKPSKINAILRPLSLCNALDAVNTNRRVRKRFGIWEMHWKEDLARVSEHTQKSQRVARDGQKAYWCKG